MRECVRDSADARGHLTHRDRVSSLPVAFREKNRKREKKERPNEDSLGLDTLQR